MNRAPWLLLLIVLSLPARPQAANKQPEQPDKEMLRMMEFLKDWDVINNMEMMRDMQQVAPEADRALQPGAHDTMPPRKKEAAK